MDQIKLRKVNLGILGFLLFACLFFSFFDLISVKIWWTSLYIYLPLLMVFGFGCWSWAKLNPKGLMVFSLVLLLVNIFLFVYGIWLWINGENLWGPVTLGFMGLTVPLLVGARMAYKKSIQPKPQ